MVAKASPSPSRRSPASAQAPSAPTSTPSSVQRFEESQRSASRIKGGAAAAPRLYDEFSSKGTPSSVGAPQGSFFPGLDMGTPQAPITLHLFAAPGTRTPACLCRHSSTPAGRSRCPAPECRRRQAGQENSCRLAPTLPSTSHCLVAFDYRSPKLSRSIKSPSAGLFSGT